MEDSSTPDDFEATLKPRSTTFPFNLGQSPQTPFDPQTPKKSERSHWKRRSLSISNRPYSSECEEMGNWGFLFGVPSCQGLTDQVSILMCGCGCVSKVMSQPCSLFSVSANLTPQSPCIVPGTLMLCPKVGTFGPQSETANCLNSAAN